MISTGPAGLRAMRAAVFGTSVLLLAAVAHLAAGGALPSLPVLLGIGLPVACVSAVLARRTRGLPTLLASLTTAQVVLHETFMSTGAGHCSPAHGSAGSGHHTTASAACDAAASTAVTHAPSLPMLALHAGAVLATALLLTHGERLVVRLAVWARGLVTVVTVPAAPTLAQRPLLLLTQNWHAPLRVATDVSRRGPPVRPALVHVIA